MLKRDDGQIIYSPSDLICFMESPFASWMDRLYLEDRTKVTPDEKTAEQQLVADAGTKHEKRFVSQLEAQHGSICEIARNSAEKDTLAALARGEPIIYQGCLSFGNFRGFTDFLVRADQQPDGRWSYEVWDTKLAKKAKPYYLVQLCCYAEMLEAIQGEQPKMLRVVLGTGEKVSFRTSEFYDYYLRLKQSFLTMMDRFSLTGNPPPPDPRADHRRWASLAEKWLLERDHLVQIAGITTGHIRKLEAAGFSTMESLAVSTTLGVPKMPLSILERLLDQARVQVATRSERCKNPAAAPVFHVLSPLPSEPRTGLALLPPPSSLDVYFDLEGFPLVENGLEYLWGATYVDAGQRNFKDWWAHESTEEKNAFEEFIDWVFARWKTDSAMHIYHYASYEKSTVRRLAGRYATREDEVDDLLRNGVFIDLYQIVRQGLRVGEDSYSIKKIERLYRADRSGAVATAGESIVEYSRWMESGEAREWQASPILTGIRNYNRDDCDSTLELAAWLREQQTINHLPFIALPPREVAAPVAEIVAQAEAQRSLLGQLRQLVADSNGEDRTLATLFLDLLEFYRREAKPMWWRYFERTEKTHEELKEDIDCIGDAQLSDQPPVAVKKSLVFTYTFDPTQETKRGPGNKVRPLANLDVSLEITELTEEGVLRVKLGTKTLADKLGGRMPQHTSFIPDENVGTVPLRQALQAVVSQWVSTRVCSPALKRLLLRQAPLLPDQAPGAVLLHNGEDVVSGAVRIASTMQASTLCLQGPPGTGKSYTAAKMIEALLQTGKRIGVMSNSHKAILNLMRAVNANLHGQLTGIKVGDEEDSFFQEAPGVKWIETSTNAATAYHGGIVGGTAWLFARPEWADGLDYLFIDEAGQVSLANVIAVSGAATHLVLLGDQMQLEQPVQGAHPGQSGQSALIYYLADHATIPETLGLFLPVTRRMHPQICRFVSDLVYEGRLQPAPGNERRSLQLRTGSPLPKPAGLLFLPVEHDGNVQASDEEADAIVSLAQSLLGTDIIGSDGKVYCQVSWRDMLFVAPYNLQVRNLRNRLPAEARVGSVDKFQGQEATVVFVSMCSSFGDYGSRGLQFILDQNRMNVAISRAQVLAVVVGDPRIAITPALTVDDMRRINLYCRLTA
jgi:uncharacterized protein